MEIIDNFLDPYHFESIKKVMTGGNFPWYTGGRTNVSGTKKNDGMYFTHRFYLWKPQSDYLNLLKPLLQKIPYDANKLSRIKGNLYPQSQRRIYHGWHVDHDTPQQACIFYINTNNGYTVFKNKKVKSIENRLLIFDPGILHRSTTCTDVPFRMNINFNYEVDSGS